MKPTVQILITCLADSLYPEVGERLVSLLERLGCDVRFPDGQTCCGQPARNSGCPEQAMPLARHTLDVFDATEGVIVAPFGSCVHMIRHGYPSLCSRDRELAGAAERVGARVRDFCDFIVNDLGLRDVARGPLPKTRVALQEECHMGRGLGVRDEPRILLDAIEGVERVEVGAERICCGFGGTFSLRQPEVSVAMADERLDRFAAAGVDRIVSTDVGCLMHMEGRARRRGLDIGVSHLLDLLEPDGSL